jgi:hypothetical protein
MQAYIPTPHPHTQDNLDASCPLSERRAGLSILGQHIAFLMRLQYRLQCACGKPFGYQVTLEALLQLAGEQLEKGVALFPSMQEAEAIALLQVLQQAEVKDVLAKLHTRFAADTSLEDIIQSLGVEYSSLEFPPRTGARGGRDRA